MRWMRSGNLRVRVFDGFEGPYKKVFKKMLEQLSEIWGPGWKLQIELTSQDMNPHSHGRKPEDVWGFTGQIFAYKGPPVRHMHCVKRGKNWKVATNF